MSQVSTEEKQDFFVVNKLQGEMGHYDERSEMLHPEMRKRSSHYAQTETHYFGFNVPKENIDAICYLVHRPNLGVIEGGVQVFQGIKKDMLASEVFDMRNYMSDQVLPENLSSYKLDSGLSFETLELCRKWRLRYDDPSRKNAFDIIVTPASDPIVWPNGLHFEQTMRNEGWLMIRGKRFDVDSYHVRDRSWEGQRLERPEPIPPITWMFGVKDENFSFQCTSFDHPELSPEWKDHFSMNSEDVLKGGWIWKDGEAAFVEKAINRVQRNPESLYPETIELDITDVKGRRVKARGTITAASPIYPFFHQRGILCQTRWETDDGDVYWGETQEAQYTDFINAMMNK